MEEHGIIIIGGGLSGLACATHLQRHGYQALILEASDRPGGRVRTDAVDGFLLDRGFQVYLSAYPTAGALLDLAGLDLRPFLPGALVWHQNQFRRVMDVWRCPRSLVNTARQPVGNWRDKWKIAQLRRRLVQQSIDTLWQGPEQSTETYLRGLGFSEQMIDVFFRSFYGGIFLERGLQTSSRFFEFTFKMFAEGHAALPAQGMQMIPNQLAACLPKHLIRCHAPVAAMNGSTVILSGGERLRAEHVVIATDGPAANTLLPELHPVHWHAVTGLYFSAPEPPLREAIIALNGSGKGLVNNVSVPSLLSAAYAPAGQFLISVSVLGDPEQAGLAAAVRRELKAWFGAATDAWQLLRSYRIPHALPAFTGPRPPLPRLPGIHVCGDHRGSPSIDGAILSGLETAEAILRG